MTREQHYAEYQRLHEIAMKKLDETVSNKDGFPYDTYLEYKETMKQANTHRRIASAMFAISINKMVGHKSI